MSLYYLLDEDKNVVDTDDMKAWASIFERNKRRVAETTVGPYWISTMFIGLDMRYGSALAAPLVFETMVFKGDASDLDCERYATWDEAVAGHERWVEVYQTKFNSEQPIKE